MMTLGLSGAAVLAAGVVKYLAPWPFVTTPLDAIPTHIAARDGRGHRDQDRQRLIQRRRAARRSTLEVSDVGVCVPRGVLPRRLQPDHAGLPRCPGLQHD